MKRLIFQVAVGPKRPLWEKCIESMAAYCKRHGITHRVLREPVLKISPKNNKRSPGALKLNYLPILEKSYALTFLGDHDEVAIIDSDVYAKPDAANIFDAVPQGYDFAAAIERNMPITAAYAAKLLRYAQGQYGDPHFPFMNMGIMVLRSSVLKFLCGQTAHEFIRRKEFEPFINGEGLYRFSTDQTLYNTWFKDCGAKVFPLPWQFNCLYGAVEKDRLPEAQLVHFFLSAWLTSDDPVEMLRTGNARPRV